MDLKKVVLSSLLVLLVIAGLVMFAAQNIENAALKTEIEETQKKLEVVSEQKNVLQEDMDELSKVVTETQNKLSSVETEKEELSKQISQLETEKKSLEEKVEEYETVVVDVQPVESEESLAGYVISKKVLDSSVEEVIDDGELNTLIDGTIKFDDKTYDVYEEIVLTPDVKILASGLGYDEKFGSGAYLGFLNKGSVLYRYVFDDKIDMTKVSSSTPLVIELLRKRLEIVSIDSNEMKVRFGEKFSLYENNEISFGDLKIVLLDISDDATTAIFRVGDKTVYADLDEKIEVGDKTMIVTKIVPVRSKDFDNDYVEFFVGDNVEKEYENADWLVEEPKWKLYWDTTGDELNFFEVSLEEKSDDLKDRLQPVEVGTSLKLPWDSYEIEFAKLTPSKYVELDFSFDEVNEEDDLLVDTNMLVIKATEKVFRFGSKEVDTVYLSRTDTVPCVWKVYYYDNKDFKKATLPMKIRYGYTEITPVLETTGSRDFVINDGFFNIRLDVRPSLLQFGNSKEEAEASDIIYNTLNLGEREYDVLTKYGIIIKAPDSSLDNDELTLLIPNERVEATIVVK